MPEHEDAVLKGWNWADRSYKNHTGDAEWLMREALRRAIDIRDTTGEDNLSARPVMLVDVLHALQSASDLESVDTITLWSEFDERHSDRTGALPC